MKKLLIIITLMISMITMANQTQIDQRNMLLSKIEIILEKSNKMYKKLYNMPDNHTPQEKMAACIIAVKALTKSNIELQKMADKLRIGGPVRHLIDLTITNQIIENNKKMDSARLIYSIFEEAEIVL